MPLRGVYIPNFGKISVKISILGFYTLIVALMGVKFGTEEWTEVAPPGRKTSKSAMLSAKVLYAHIDTDLLAKLLYTDLYLLIFQ